MSISLLHTLAQTPIAVFDVETTGASADLGDRVVEIGIVRLLNGQVVDRYEQLIDPKRAMQLVHARCDVSEGRLPGEHQGKTRKSCDTLEHDQS